MLPWRQWKANSFYNLLRKIFFWKTAKDSNGASQERHEGRKYFSITFYRQGLGKTLPAADKFSARSFL